MLSASVLGLSLAACTDSWDDHYSQIPDTQYGNASIYEVLAAQPELSDFCRVLDQATMFANFRNTPVTYKELLNADQFFTVWAPVNGTFNADSLIAMCQTNHGDSLVEVQFLKNHIARYSHSFGNTQDSTVSLLNSKKLSMVGDQFGTTTIVKPNITARNGIIHVVKEPSKYFNNIYEAMSNLPQLQHLGSFFKGYERYRFNESASLAMGVVDGKTVYIDSVFYMETYSFGYIRQEDSLMWMLAPTKEVWEPVYEEAKSYFNYCHMAKGDSLTNLYAHDMLMTDLFYNPKSWKQRSIQDSIVSVGWYQNTLKERYHVYFKPFQPGGLFAQNWVEKITCSNGTIYVMDQWPFDKTKLYFQPIEISTSLSRLYDYGGNAKKSSSIEVSWFGVDNDSIESGYLSVVPEVSTDAYYAEFEVPRVLSGEYDIYCVVLPKSVNSRNDVGSTAAGIRNRLPNKFTVEITYRGKDNQEYVLDSKNRYEFDESLPQYYVKSSTAPYLFEGNAVSKGARDYTSYVNNPLRVDTIKLCTMKFPTCNYGQSPITNRIKIINNVKKSEARDYADFLYLSAIVLKPHSEN